MQKDITEKLKDACIGHPFAKIKWPHRILHEAHDEIITLRKALSQHTVIESVCQCDSNNYSYGFAKCLDCGKIKNIEK
jgi:hypothetical protein